MASPCGGQKEEPKITLRNGMDYEPKKKIPPDYSNVPSVRDWQMSPFSNERFDLNDIQIAEKKGFKGQKELEKLKVELGMAPAPKPEKKKSECQICAERKAAERLAHKGKCTVDYLYQPYGPNIVSSTTYSNPGSSRPKMYSYLGPSFYAGYRFKIPAPTTVIPIPCQETEFKKRKKNLKKVYIPYGPINDIRMPTDVYTPMGPSVAPLTLSEW